MKTASPKLARLFSHGRQLTYRKDDVIIRPGDVPSGMYCVTSGWVKAYTLCRDGEPNIIMTLCPGEVFPLAWALNRAPRDIGFAALDATEVRRIPPEQFRRALETDPGLLQTAAETLAQHFFTLAGEIDNLQYRSAREKVVYRLLYLAQYFGEHHSAPVALTVRVTNDYIARSTNMTRETASRELSRLSRKQLIRVTNGRIVIPDPRRLGREISARFNPATLSWE